MPPYTRQYVKRSYGPGARYKGYMTNKRMAAARRSSYISGKRAAANRRTGGFVDVENKFLDSELAYTAVTTSWAALNPTGTGCTNSISVPSQGDGESERDGRVYYIKSVHVKGFVKIDTGEDAIAPITPLHVRVIVYWDTQTNAAEATATDIMDAGGGSDVLAFRNLQNSKRFIVLYDETMHITPDLVNNGASNAFSWNQATTPFVFNKLFKKPIKVRCKGTAANVSSVADNNIGIAAVTEDGLVGGPDPEITYQARIRFQG